MRRLSDSSAESVRRASLCFGGLFLSILRRGAGGEGIQQSSGNRGNLIDRRHEGGFVRFRRSVKSAYLSHELERSRANLLGRGGRIEVEERPDIPAHRR